MPHDELTRPLGLPSPVAQRERLSWRAVMTGFACVLGASAGIYAWIIDDGLGGRPRAIVRIEDAPKPAASAQADAGQAADRMPTGTVAAQPPRATAEEVENHSGVRVVRQGGGYAPGALIITVQDALSISLTPAPDRMLVEKGPHGPLPRIGADGRKPVDVYSRPMSVAQRLPPGAPRIAIMVGGMGLNQPATRLAVDRLPPAVTLAFAPYGSGLAGQAAYAREKGHEIILQVPLEPFDLAGDGPGPRMLRTSQERAELRDNLHWHMSRFQGYTGIANFLGAKFQADAKAMSAVVEEAGARGLLILDDGSAPQSLTPKLAAANATPHLVADVLIDADRAPAAIAKALLRLETVAREKGIATGVASGLPDVIERVAAFATGLEKRGIALVPVSAAAVKTSRPASSAGR